ncbi:MAG: GGDEF domain-containing protein, partial [Gammaproteobacteria bacterium]
AAKTESTDDESLSTLGVNVEDTEPLDADMGEFNLEFKETESSRDEQFATRGGAPEPDTEQQRSTGESPDEAGDHEDSLSAQGRDNEEMKRLHQDFLRQIRSIMAENEEFGVHLGLEIDALDQDTRVNDVEERRNAILGSLKKLSDSHAQLAKKFDTAQTYLSIIESDKKKLSDELERARKLSLTDDLTSLPNRRAFMRRMDDEVSRVKRYGFPLSLVLIDIDYFKQVNDEFGHNAGDSVLRVYAEKILSVFRHHDMIARYGGEEFAVLLPNTDLEGVLRALDKVKGTVPKVKCHISGVTISAPTFSAGVAEYHAPETPTQFIERADHALYRAKRLGRDRIEVEHNDHEHDMMDQT